MINTDSYRQYAADCVRQAEAEATPEDKNILLNMALAWLRLARQIQTHNTGALPGSESGAPPQTH